MKEQWKTLSDKLEALSLRERVMIFVAVLFMLGSLLNTLFLEPLRKQHKMLDEQFIQQQDQLRDTSIKLGDLLQASRADANSPVRDQIAQLRKQLDEGEAVLHGWSDRLVPPDQMAGLLEQVLSKNARLQLVNLQTLPPEPLIAKAAGAKDAAANKPAPAQDQQVFKHGVQISVRGSYADLLQYLAALERLPSQMYWGRAQLKVEQYPSATLTLTLYTLSLDKTWLAL
ncbi:MAG: agglutinin biogenesis protein [Nitrosomonadales bacterium]|nr:agglutinin biogenesis protein [Nitrosomonadales bacterium]